MDTVGMDTVGMDTVGMEEGPEPKSRAFLHFSSGTCPR